MQAHHSITTLAQHLHKGLITPKPAYRILLATIDNPNYLTGGHAYTIHNGTSSTTTRFMNGIPQGLNLSPTFSNLPLATHPCVQILSYADEITLFSQYRKPETAAAHLQVHIYILEQWRHTNRLKVSPTKSSLTLTTPRSKQRLRHTTHFQSQ